MSSNFQQSDEPLLARLGERVAQLRISKNLTQAELAQQAGLGLATVQRLEQGAAATQLAGFVRVCRVLGVVDGFDALLPAPQASPLAQLKLQGKPRQRASKAKTAKPAAPWTWGDET